MAYVPPSYHVNAPRGGTRYIMKQVRFHRNIAASSLATDCNLPQQPARLRSFASIQVLRRDTHTSLPALSLAENMSPCLCVYIVCRAQLPDPKPNIEHT